NGTVNSTASGVASETTNILNTTVVLDGNYTYYVSCSDGVAITNSTSQSFIYDVTAPAINSTMPSEYNDTQITNNSFVLNVTITESYLNYSNLTITAPDGTIIFANQSTSLSFTEVVSLTGLPDGQYNASARALDLAGTLTTKNWFFTAARGRVSLVYPVNGTVYSRGNILVLEVNETQSTDTLANVTVTVNGTVYQALNDTVNGSNYWQYNYTIPVTMDSGQLNLTAMAYDSNGALRANASGYVLLNPNYSLFVSSRALYANGSTVNQTIVVRDANTNLVADATVSCARNNTAGSPASLNNGSYECLYASTVYGQYLLYANASKSGNFGNASTTTLVRQTNLAISISNLVKSSMAATNVTNSLVFPYDDLGHANGSVRFTFNMTDALNGSLVSGGFTFITYAHNGSVLVNDSGIISGVYTYNLTLDGIVPNISGMYAVSINVTDTDSMRAGLQTESNVSYWLAYVKYPTGIYVQGKPLPFNVTIWHNGTLMNVTNLTAVLHDNNGVEVTRETYPGQISAAGMGIYAGNFSTSGLTGGQNYFLSVSVYNLSVSDGAETAILAQDKDLDVTPETDTVAPGYSNLTNTTNVPERGEFINVSAYWTDNGQLSFSFLETNASGVLANVSNLTLSSNESYTNYSIDTSNLAYNTTVKWRLWVNDTSTVAAGGNWNFTPYYTFTVTDRTLPVNLGVSLSPQLVGVGNNVALRINASDNNNLSSVVAVVARPDGAMSLQLLSRISGNDTNATWEANITTSAAGRHNLTQVNITDTWGNVNSTNYTGQYFTVVVYSYLLGPGSYNTSADLNSTFNYMFMLNNTGTGNLTINISTNASWAVANESLVAVSNGSLSNFTVAFNLTNLTGNHTVQVIANGSSWAGMQSSNITIMIRQSGYTLVPASESVQVQSGAVENRTYMLSNTGTENLTINLTANASFAILNATQLNLTSGASANFSVSYDMSDLRGWHTVLVVANASGGAGVKSASVSLYAANSSYTYAPSTVALGLQAGEVRNVSYELNNTGTENLTLNLSTNVSWVVVNESQINLTAGSSRNFTVGYNSSGLMGSYPVLVYVNASNGLGERTSLAYLFVGVYNFTVSGGNVNVVLNNNTNHTTEDVNFTIINTGNSNLAMVCSSNLSWLTNQTACSGELAGGATRAVSYRLNATGVSEGVYSGQINVSDATAGLRQVNQTIAVTEIPIYTFTVAPSTEAFGVINDSYLDRNYELVNTGNRNVSVACASNSSWAYNTTACGGVLTSAQQQTVTFRYNAMGVAGGSYLTQINFTDSFGDASLQQVNGVITVSSAVYYSYTLVPDVDQFWQALGRNATHTYLISNVGNQPLVLGIASNESFAQLLNNSTVGLGVGGSYNFSVLYSTGSLANGTYLVTLNVSTGNQSLLSNITMTVLTANYTVSPGETVYVGAGEGQVQARQYVLNNTGSSNLTLVIGGNATFAAANESALTLSASGVQNITVTFNASGQPEGSQGLEFTVNDSTSASVRTLSLNLTVVSVSFISPPTPNEDSMSSYNNLTMNVSFSTALDSASVNNNGTDYAMSSGDGGLTWNATVSPLEEGRNGLSVTGIKNGMSVAGGNRTFYQNTTSVKAITFDYIGSNGSVINLSASGVSLAVPNTTTNFSQYDSSAVPNVTLVKYGVAVIIFNNSTSNLSGSILDGNVVLLSNNVMVNSSVLPALNRSAIIILYNLSHIQPIILRDGETCPSAICMQLSYSGGTLVFSVTQFSTYSTSEGYVAASGATGSGISGGKDRNIYSEFSPGCAGENLTVDYKTREPAELFVFVSGPYGEEVFSGRVQSNVNGSLVVVPKSIGEYKFYVRGEGYLESLKEVSVGSCGGAVMQVEPEPPKNASAGAVAVANASGGGLPQPQVNATVGGNYSWLLIVAGNYTVRANDLSSKGVDISELNGLLVRAKVVYVQKDYELAKGLLDEVEGELGRLESSVQSPESGVQSSGTQDPGPKTGYPQPETPAPGQDILPGLMAVTGLSSVMLAGIALLVIATIIVLYMLRKKKVI
ncbi:TPA: hypothetical protein HA316_05095, partial [Candidatus Micrarchaeota archaeon]|nr:hypothetical protein [Candidatus Micrarchaeota archaeon]